VPEELRRSEAELRGLAGKLISVQEDERKRIARDLHDDFSQRLALHCLKLDLLRQSPPAGSETAHKLQQARNDANELAIEVWRISHNLHHPQLALGLQHGIASFCREFFRAVWNRRRRHSRGRSGTPFGFRVKGDLVGSPVRVSA
jgi:signal transduction histidine kinase